MKLSRFRRERGSVLVFVAAAMFPIVAMMTYAIDVSHWFAYSRNLQNRADAAAFAGAAQYGNICFTGSSGDQWTGLQSTIGKWAQLYSGPGGAASGETAQGSAAGNTGANLPYTDSSVLAPSGATTSSTYINPTNLTLGNLNQYYVRLNANNYADKGGVNFAMGDFCSSDPKKDQTDKDPGQPGAMVDVKVTQHQLPNFIPIFNFLGHPNIEAHARVELQQEVSSPGVRPIAVRDSAFTPCVSVNFVNATTNAVIKTVTLTKEAQAKLTDPVVWDNNTAPASIPIPTSDNVYIQPFLSICNGNGQTYDDSTNTGLLYINSHPQSDPPTASGDAPKLTSGGVTLSGSCAPDQYFSVGGCTATLSVWAEFNPSVTNSNYTLTATDVQSGGTTTPITLSTSSFNKGAPTNWTGTLSVPDSTGIHQIQLDWTQTAGSVNGTACGTGKGKNPAPCTGTFGIQQEAFGACDGCDQPDDSGPIILAELSQPGVGAETNSLPAGTTQQLVVTLQLAGVSAAQPGDPATILRFGGGQQTGLIDCGQGSGASADVEAIAGGCGPQNTAFNPPLNPLFVNQRNGDCTNPPWPDGNHQDCVQTTPGNRRSKIPGGIADVVTNNGASCPTNFWQAKYNYSVDPSSDPRAITMIITSDVDLTLARNGSQAWIPIWQFATFYVTGWDSSGSNPNCANNEAFPVKGKKNQQNGTIWGHWINYVDPTGTGGGTPCNFNQLGNCVPVLTR